MKKPPSTTGLRQASAAIALSSVAFALLLLSASTHADDLQKVVKIVGPDGKVTYTDREFSGRPAGRVQPLKGGQVLAEVPAAGAQAPSGAAPRAAASAPSPSAPSAAPAGASSLVQLATQQEAALKAQEKNLKEVKETVDKSNCENAKRNLSSMQGRVTKVNEKGEKEVLNDEQMASEKDKIQKQIAQFCK